MRFGRTRKSGKKARGGKALQRDNPLVVASPDGAQQAPQVAVFMVFLVPDQHIAHVWVLLYQGLVAFADQKIDGRIRFRLA